MIKFVTLIVWLHFFYDVSSRTTPYDKNALKALDGKLAPGQITLNDMFREVEKLMEDTQHKLEEAVHQVGYQREKASAWRIRIVSKLFLYNAVFHRLFMKFVVFGLEVIQLHLIILQFPPTHFDILTLCNFILADE